MDASFYSTSAWRDLREQARSRDGNRCSVSRLLGGDCSGLLHVHHLDPLADPLDLDGLLTVCQRHHPKIEAVRRSVLNYRGGSSPCPHRHVTAEGRAQCERRRQRRLAPSA